MRLDKFLAETGRGTRTAVKKLVNAGKVKVNGEVVKDPAAKIDENKDEVSIDGEVIAYADLEYYMLNKPKGVISASRDKKSNTVCVTDLIKEKIRSDLFPVGRLDKDTEGLLIITNDGDLAHRMLSPKKHVDKTYFTELDGTLSKEAAERIMNGVDIGDEKPTLPCNINILSDRTCFITIHEGRYHEIKRMFQTEGLRVTGLKRISMGPISLDPELQSGEYRCLSEAEIELLKNFDKADKN
ncbi:MAG: pseudouridine synthase [Eubacteriales bacterium]|nr:pseudouridine synthase [Eubacteriales bacterium]